MFADVQQLFERLPTSVKWSEREPGPKFGDDLDPSDPLMPYLEILLIGTGTFTSHTCSQF